jgi:RND family efflux transporter MFP subunit
VTAPFDGVITRKPASVGDQAGPGKTLLEIEDPVSLRLETDVPEATIGRIRLGASLPVRIDALGRELPGTVAEIAPAADPNTRTFHVKLDLPSTDGLRAGLFARVSIPMQTAEIITVPAGAVTIHGQMETVFVVAHGQARLRLVRTGKHREDAVEILSGIDSGERVVVAPPAELKEGRNVTIESTEGPGSK